MASSEAVKVGPDAGEGTKPGDDVGVLDEAGTADRHGAAGKPRKGTVIPGCDQAFGAGVLACVGGILTFYRRDDVVAQFLAEVFGPDVLLQLISLSLTADVAVAQLVGQGFGFRLTQRMPLPPGNSRWG